MKTQENFNEHANGVAALKVWTAPEIKILTSENAESGAGVDFDGGDFTVKGPPVS